MVRSMARLIIVGERGKADKEFTLGDTASLGRHPSQDIQILDRVVSKEHASIIRRQHQYYLADLGSRNGTFLNGQRVQGSVPIQDGDEVLMGNTRMLFKADQAKAVDLLQKVTIASEGHTANIQGRIAGTPEMRFVPETEIGDDKALRRDYEKLRIALQLSQDLGIERDLDKLLERILDRAFALFAADRAVILLVDEKTGKLTPQHVKTRNKVADNITISRSVLKEVVTERACVLSTDAVMDERFASSHSIILSGIRSAMSVPLLAKDKLLGIIYLDSLMSTGAFTERDTQLLSGFANQAAVAIENSRLVARLEKEALARDRLGRLLSPNLVNQVVSGELDVKQGGELREATVLFSDIRGFTAMSEDTDPQTIVDLLNAYFEVMVDLIFKYEGTLDKFIGDAIMAIWGAAVQQERGPLRAVLSAMEMQSALKHFNRVMQADGLPQLDIGIGVNTGPMVCGYMGSSKTMEYTAIGDSVNLSSRLCSAAAPGQVLISESTWAAVRDHVPIERDFYIEVKGKKGKIHVYEVGKIRQGESLPEAEALSLRATAEESDFHRTELP